MTTAVTISDRAARRIGEILSGEGGGAMLRISVEGGGCSGFQYKFDIERPLAGMAERRMAEIVRQRQRFREVLVQPQLPRQSAGDLCHLQRMGQAGAVMVALMEHEHLGLVLQAAERGGMDHPVAIPAERAAGPALRLGDQPAAAVIGIAGIGRARGSHSDGHGEFSPYRFDSVDLGT